MKKYIINAFWDQESKVWVASSEDILGLVTEAENLEILVGKLKVIIPELLIFNGLINDENIKIEWDLITHHQDLIKMAS